MLFTKASEYALLSLIYISQKETPQDVDSLALELDIPKSFLAKILQTLAKDGLLKSFKGAKGGFALIKEPNQYTIKEIVNSAEKKDISVFECSGGTCPNNKEKNCTLMPMLVNLQNKVDEFLDSITLEDIMKNNGKK
ncbi:Rrf2 family transcriptional regulator [Campylobacter jejuni]|uniref:Rrf2 family transcriptional regulator n=1 Tax=Campylobacter TaxID=194 RepID=UPI0001C27EE9|nr:MULTISPECIES: RrF2 family transcriptional regulator [Campylobacter]EFC30120.1 LOW QUALITY PROTEIN: RrF2 family protein, putative [Campylobacter jejuni subsp. jejuni 1336]AXL33754.1 Rrf2 family transcriptional regulator [Campylobacter jejuni]EAB5248864.1 RrF2 family transcriptional regulator [Campylobacter jejuni]EAI1791343.1 RrF2 family transcriptional regulator [Campylobacter jejuni]EAI2872212.1 RrF2 family transcriptional regulator [Campylobacter jejuni]